MENDTQRLELLLLASRQRTTELEQQVDELRVELTITTQKLQAYENDAPTEEVKEDATEND